MNHFLNLLLLALGICPQHNVLFDHLTVEEHLWFFTTLKGINDKNLITTEVNRMIESIGLTDKKNSKPNSLSGGMKRKLSVGIALVGNSKVKNFTHFLHFSYNLN